MDKPDIPLPNLEAEESVLGCIFCDPARALPIIGRLVQATDFLHQPNRLIYQALLSLWQSRQTTDVSLLTQAMRGESLNLVGGPSRLSELSVLIPTLTDLEFYIEDLRAAADNRRVWDACRRVVSAACAPRANPADLAADLSRLLTDLSLTRASEPLTMAQHVDLALERYEHAATHKNELPAGSLRTGIRDLDEWVVLAAGDLAILAAETSGGKTALALQIVGNAAVESAASVLVVSYEMTSAQLTDRMISHMSRVPAWQLRMGVTPEMGYHNLTAALPKLSAAPIHLRDAVGHWTVDDVAAEARAIKAKHGLGLIVVDYVQIAAPRRGFNNREREVADISRNLKSLALELQVPVLALSQLNENGMLRESRAVSHDANTILVIKDDPDGREDWRMITVAKNRDGVRDKNIPVSWNGPLMKFS